MSDGSPISHANNLIGRGRNPASLQIDLKSSRHQSDEFAMVKLSAQKKEDITAAKAHHDFLDQVARELSNAQRGFCSESGE